MRDARFLEGPQNTFLLRLMSRDTTAMWSYVEAKSSDVPQAHDRKSTRTLLCREAETVETVFAALVSRVGTQLKQLVNHRSWGWRVPTMNHKTGITTPTTLEE